jgi:hypothetical protein
MPPIAVLNPLLVRHIVVTDARYAIALAVSATGATNQPQGRNRRESLEPSSDRHATKLATPTSATRP